VELFGHYYSVPYRLAREEVEIRYTPTLVSVVKSICRFMYGLMCRSRALMDHAMASPPFGLTWSFSR
jgi:hypothetical protein